MTRSDIRWPDSARPERATIHAFNESYTPATPEAVWSWLVRARDWPTWYDNCRALSFDAGEGPDLAPGRRFRWTTFGVRVATRIEEFEPPYRLAWRGTAFGSSGYHAWLLERHAGRTRIVTEETQRGVIPFLGQLYLRGAIVRQHQRWVDALGRLAAAGQPSFTASPAAG